MNARATMQAASPRLVHPDLADADTHFDMARMRIEEGKVNLPERLRMVANSLLNNIIYLRAELRRIDRGEAPSQLEPGGEPGTETAGVSFGVKTGGGTAAQTKP